MTLLKTTFRRARLALVLGAAFAAGAVACDDPFAPHASAENIDRTFELWALTGGPVSHPSAITLALADVSDLDAAGSFDLAFDIDTSGRLLVLPMGSVVSPILGSREISFQRGSGPYNTIVEAPKSGWTTDSVLQVNPGGAFLAKVTTVACQYDIRHELYAKFYVDSVIPAERRIKLSARINPNCGYRSLLTGVPEF